MKKNVLLVEDDPALRMVMREVLKEEFEIDEADNGDDGIDLGMRPENDLIILDYHLPKKDGLEVIAAVKEAHPNVPVIVLTGYLNAESEEQFNRLGADKIFPKPFNYKTLLETVKDLSARKIQTPSGPLPTSAPNAHAPALTMGTESEALHDSLAALSSLAEKVEFLQTITEKYWIEPSDISAIRETARCMDSQLRAFYGKLNHTVFEQGDFSSPMIQKTPKPLWSGHN